MFFISLYSNSTINYKFASTKDDKLIITIWVYLIC